MTKLGRAAAMAGTAPLLALALVVGLLDRLLEGDGTAAEWLARPFLRAAGRGRRSPWGRW